MPRFAVISPHRTWSPTSGRTYYLLEGPHDTNLLLCPQPVACDHDTMPAIQPMCPDFLFLPASRVFPDHSPCLSALPCSNPSPWSSSPGLSTTKLIPLPLWKVNPQKKTISDPTSQKPIGKQAQWPMFKGETV